MSLSASNINSLRNVVSPANPSANDVLNDVSSAIANPIGSQLNKVLFKLNGLTASVQGKIDNLIADTQKQTDNKATVQLVNNTLVVSSKPEDAKIAAATTAKIQTHINSINGSLGQMTTIVGTLSTIAKAAQMLQKALEIQEMLLTLNPVTKATFTVFKKAIKIVFLKEMLKQYNTVISAQLAANKSALSALTDKFHQLHVQTVIGDSNNTITPEEAAQQITTEKITTTPVAIYTATNGKDYTLKIEKYGINKLVGRAYDSYSGQIITQTAPSIIATTDELMDELKRILDNQ
jgi:hypothetical protein